MKTEEVKNALFRYFNSYRGYTYQLCNAYVFKWESDFFCIASSGYSYEIEVKISKSDYKADFKKKEKHRILSADHSQPTKVGKAYAARQTIKNGQKCNEVIYAPFYKHLKRGILIRKNKYPLCTNIRWINPAHHTPNKFLYACPEGLITPESLPQYAGLVYIPSDKRKKPKIIVKPPVIHRTKNDFTKTLLKKYYWAYLNSLGHKKHGKNFEFPNQ